MKPRREAPGRLHTGTRGEIPTEFGADSLPKGATIRHTRKRQLPPFGKLLLERKVPPREIRVITGPVHTVERVFSARHYCSLPQNRDGQRPCLLLPSHVEPSAYHWPVRGLPVQVYFNDGPVERYIRIAAELIRSSAVIVYGWRSLPPHTDDLPTCRPSQEVAA